MTSVRTKTRQRPKKWMLSWWRAVGEFKNGERQMLEVGRFTALTYRNAKLARKGKCRIYREPFVAFIYFGRKPKKITELDVNYSVE